TGATLQREDILTPERSVVPALAVVPLEQDAPRSMLGREIDIGKQVIALADGVAGGVVVEPVGVRALGGRLGVGVLPAHSLRLPGAIGSRSGGRSLGEPLVFGLLLRRNQAFAGRQPLHLATGDFAVRLDGDADLAALGAGHAAGLLLAAGRLIESHVVGAADLCCDLVDNGPLHQPDAVFMAPGAAALDAVAAAILVARAEAGTVGGGRAAT